MRERGTRRTAESHSSPVSAKSAPSHRQARATGARLSEGACRASRGMPAAEAARLTPAVVSPGSTRGCADSPGQQWKLSQRCEFASRPSHPPTRSGAPVRLSPGSSKASVRHASTVLVRVSPNEPSQENEPTNPLPTSPTRPMRACAAQALPCCSRRSIE